MHQIHLALLLNQIYNIGNKGRATGLFPQNPQDMEATMQEYILRLTKNEVGILDAAVEEHYSAEIKNEHSRLYLETIEELKCKVASIWLEANNA